MEVRVTFAVGKAEVVVVTEDAKGLKELLQSVSESVRDTDFSSGPTPTVGLEQKEGGKLPASAGSIQDRVRLLADQIGGDETRLGQIIHFGDEYPLLLRSVGGGARTEQQRAAALILGMILDLVYGKPVVEAALYTEILRKSNIDEQRFYNAMNGLAGRFISKGTGRASSYEITVPGRNEGLARLRDLLAEPA